MPVGTPVRSGWVLPVLLSITTASALVLAFLFVIRPNAGELGAIRVVVTDDGGKSAGGIHVVVAEAPLVQRDTVSPGMALTGTVHYPVPYLSKPNLKLTGSKRQYAVMAESEFEFTWTVRLLPDDYRDGKAGEGNVVENLLVDATSLASLKGALKPGLTFDDFTWEAKGLRAPSLKLPQTYEQTGTFFSSQGREGMEFFPIPYDSPPNVELSSDDVNKSTIIVECTAKGFQWRQSGELHWFGTVKWKAKGIRNLSDAK
jgi:hypothetical protein